LIIASYVGSGTVGVVGKCIYDDGDTVGAVTFVSHILIVYIAHISGCLLDTALDGVVGHVVGFCLGNNGCQFEIVGGIGTALFYSDCDLTADNGKNLTLCSIVLFFFMLNISKFGMS
jgi:hypothetical protein